MLAKERFRRMWRARPAPAMISVHRGLWNPLPENSRAAIREGASFGVVEIDTQIAADGVPVVMHDTSLSRMTGDSRTVAEVASNHITSMPLREAEGGRHTPFTPEMVPTLKDVLMVAPESAFFDIDVKHPEEVEAVASFLEANDLGHHGTLKIDVQTADDIQLLRSLEKRFDIMVMAKVIITSETLALFPVLVAEDVAAAEVWFDDLALLERACATAGDAMAVSTFTLDPVHCCGLSDAKACEDPDAVWGRLIAAGVSVIMTDRPRELDAYLTASSA